MDHNKLWEIVQEIGIPDHLTCLLRNLYADQEAIVRTGHGTTDWFQIRKGVHDQFREVKKLIRQNHFEGVQFQIQAAHPLHPRSGCDGVMGCRLDCDRCCVILCRKTPILRRGGMGAINQILKVGYETGVTVTRLVSTLSVTV